MTLKPWQYGVGAVLLGGVALWVMSRSAASSAAPADTSQLPYFTSAALPSGSDQLAASAASGVSLPTSQQAAPITSGGGLDLGQVNNILANQNAATVLTTLLGGLGTSPTVPNLNATYSVNDGTTTLNIAPGQAVNSNGGTPGTSVTPSDNSNLFNQLIGHINFLQGEIAPSASGYAGTSGFSGGPIDVLNNTYSGDDLFALVGAKVLATTPGQTGVTNVNTLANTGQNV